MKNILITGDNQQKYFFRLSNGFLFIRGEIEDKFNNLARGRQRLKILISEKDTTGTSIYCLLVQGELEKTYELPANFDFNCRCYEFVIIDSFYADVKKNISDILISHPQASLKEIFHDERLYRKSEPTIQKSKVGRQKVFRDESTGEIVGMKAENKRIFDLWEAGDDYESIRFAIHPKTKSSPKKSAEVSKIKRKLRKYKHLLKRKYVRK